MNFAYSDHTHVANMQIKKQNILGTLEAPVMSASSHYSFRVNYHLAFYQYTLVSPIVTLYKWNHSWESSILCL